MKKYSDGSKNNYKIYTDNEYKAKYLYYKQDNKIQIRDVNYICNLYIYTKYLQKIYSDYVFNNSCLLTI